MNSADIISGLPAAAGLSAALLLILGRPWRRGASANDADWPAALALAAGYVCAHVLIFGWPAAVPRESTDWLVHAAVAGCAAGMTTASVRIPSWVRWPVHAVVSCGLAAALLRWKLTNETWEPLEAAGWFAVLGTAVCVLWAVLGMQARRRGPASTEVHWLVLTGGLAGVVLVGGFARLAILGAALGAPLTVLWLVAFITRRLAVRPATVAVVALLSSGILINGVFLADIPTSAALLAAVAAVAASWTQLFAMPRSALLRNALGVVTTAMLLGAAIWLTHAATPADPYAY